MTVERNKAVVRHLFEAVVAKRDFDGLDDLISPDYVDHNAGRYGWTAGREGFRQHVEFLHGVFPDVVITIEELVAERDRVVLFWRLEGVHRGELWGVAPTGRRVSGSTTSLLRLKDGRLVEYEARPDRLGLLVQLGGAGEYVKVLKGLA